MLVAYTGVGQEYVPETGPRKYNGKVAELYNAKRIHAPKWTEEDYLIKDMLFEIPDKSRVLDVPVGTGRFIKHWIHREFDAVGVDVSDDMLSEARREGEIDLKIGTVTALDFEDESFDASVMCRLTRWLTPPERTLALQELQRVTKKRIVFTARMNGQYAYPMEEIEGALDGWEITRNDGLPSDENYRIIQLERK
jgi:ubiquinone/menaquinone biosynthesis C-methylase UbiE